MLFSVRAFRKIQIVQDGDFKLRVSIATEMNEGFVGIRQLTRPKRELVKRLLNSRSNR